MNYLLAMANRFINFVFMLFAAGFAIAMAIFAICAVCTWAFTDDGPGQFLGRAVGCLVFALAFKFLSTLDEYEFIPTRTTTTTTTRRAASRRPARKA